MIERMSSRERWLAALRCQAVDRLPFWPKIDGAYAPYQQKPFQAMCGQEFHRWVGSDRHIWAPDCVRTLRKNTSVEQVTDGARRITDYRTPAGSLTMVERFDPVSQSWHPTEFPVKREQDIAVMGLAYSDERYEFDTEEYDRGCHLMKQVGSGGIVVTSMGISPLMHWIQHLAGVEVGHLLLIDARPQVEALFDVMHAAMCRRLEIIADRSPYPVVYSVENTSTTLISPQMFRRYCHGHLARYGEIIGQAGKIHVLHMCGKLKLLLPDIAALPAAAIEAFTSPPVGNTTLLDGRSDCPNQCLIGGTNAVLWLEDAETIIRTLQADLDALRSHRGIVVTSAGVMPPACKPETIRRVGQWLKTYPVAA